MTNTTAQDLEIATVIRRGSEDNKTNAPFTEDKTLGDHIFGIPSKVGILYPRLTYLAEIESQYGAQPIGFKVYLEPIFD